MPRVSRLLLLTAVVYAAGKAFLPGQGLIDFWQADEGIVVQRGVRFAHFDDGEDLRLDLAAPGEGEALPAVVFIHGGGWRSEGSAFRNEIIEVAKHGYVGVRIRYRLLGLRHGQPVHVFPTQLDDVRAALDWLVKNAASLRIDPQRVALVGVSAGGQLALLAGLDSSSAAPHRYCIRAIVNMYGPTDLLAGYRKYARGRPLISQLLGGTPEEAPQRYFAASPVNFAHAGSPPTLTIHGAEDHVVPVEQAELLDERMRAEGAWHRLIVLEGQGHGFDSDAYQQAMDEIYDFLARQFEPDAAPAAAAPHQHASAGGR